MCFGRLNHVRCAQGYLIQRNLVHLVFLFSPDTLGAMKPIELKDLYPDLTPEELLVAKENLDCYLTLVWEICEEEHERRQSAVDSPVPRGTIEERSIPT